MHRQMKAQWQSEVVLTVPNSFSHHCPSRSVLAIPPVGRGSLLCKHLNAAVSVKTSRGLAGLFPSECPVSPEWRPEHTVSAR